MVMQPTVAALALTLATAANAGDGSALDASLEVAARAAAAETVGQTDDDIIDGSSLALRVAPSLSIETDAVLLTFSDGLTRVEYFADDRTDRWQNVARLSAEFGAGSATSLQIWGERSDNIITAEAPLVDEWEAGARVQQELSETSRVQLGARWRERRYDDVAQSNGSGPRFEAEYRYRFAANNYAYLRGRYEDISSSDARRDMSRWTALASYQHPIVDDLLVRPSVSWSRLDFSGRALTTGGFRRDTVLSPEIELVYSPGSWRFAAEARYVDRQSTDIAFDRSGYRLALEVSYVF